MVNDDDEDVLQREGDEQVQPRQYKATLAVNRYSAVIKYFVIRMVGKDSTSNQKVTGISENKGMLTKSDINLISNYSGRE